MITDIVDDQRQVEACGIKCQLLARSPEVSKSSVNVTHCVLEPGMRTGAHQHREDETFFILEGEGVFESEGAKVELTAGSTITAAPFTEHTLINSSTTDKLVFLSIYSDFSTIARRPHRQAVIVAPPTPNGDLHLGHMGGPYLASDIYQRYLRTRNHQVFYFSGTDDYQNYVQALALRNGKTSASEVASTYRKSIVQSFGSAGMEFDELLHPQADQNYRSFAQSFFKTLLAKQIFELRDLPTFFEASSGKVVLESLIQGNCPECRAVVVGNCCEDCGYVGDVGTLLNPSHVQGVQIVLKPVRRAVFDLAKFRGEDYAYVGANEFSARLRQISEGATGDGKYYPVSYPGEWGVSTDTPELSGQIMNVWVEMAASYAYVAASKQFPFLDKDKVQTTLFCGIDNAFYYAVLIPLILKNFDQGFSRPYEVQLNEFWNLEGQKFSTSRRHAIWANDFFKKHDADEFRFYAAYRRPNFGREDFTMNDYENTLGTLQMKALDQMIDQLAEMKHAEFGELAGAPAPRTIVELQDILNLYEKNFELVSSGIKRNAHLAAYLIHRTRDAYLKLSRADENQYDFIYMMRILGTLLTPYMPKRGRRILDLFRLAGGGWVHDISLGLAQEEIMDFHDLQYGRVE